MILHTLCESVFSLRNRIGKIPFPYPINTIPGQLTAKPVYAPLRSALNEHPLDVQRRCLLPGKCLLVQARQPLVWFIAQKEDGC